ncbi:MAG: class II glutamine amidotransferase [Stagnimonas sp.]|nr:class II glutamine amidotransferase [Stagnimonas sp.]
MCVIVHKPPDARIPPDLVRAALALNNDGWGLMGFGVDGRLIIERHAASEHASIAAALAKHADADLVLHLRQRTRGSNERENAHPFKVAEHLYLMHNGTLPIHSRVAGKSDTWHFVHDILRPLHARHAALFDDPAFLTLLELGLKQENKVVLLDERAKSIAVLNRAHGVEFEGLWLSNTRWIDRSVLPLTDTPQPQQRSYAADKLHFG